MSEGKDSKANPTGINDNNKTEQIQHGPSRLNSTGHALAGMSASLLNTIILYPLDVVKTRFQGISK
jgi:hypothetical protein